jgi:type I restriction-modification system DNA methylase subunit
LQAQNPKDRARKLVGELCGAYAKIVSEGRKADFSEADVGSKFILPLIDALGWDIRNIDEVKEQRRTLTGPVDYSLNLNLRAKLFVEIKRFDENLDGKRIVRGKEQTFPEQAIQYAWHVKLDWAVLTNFEELRLYYSHVIKPKEGRVFEIPYTKYLERFEELWALSREEVASGRLETYEKRRTRKNIDEEVLDDLLTSRVLLTENIRINNPGLSVEEAKESVQKILDRLIVIRVAEDRGIIGSDSLWHEQDSWSHRDLPTPLMRSLKSLFRDFDDIYNTKLFEAHPCEDLKIESKSLETIISALYDYNFDLLAADVLGAIYEDYLGHVLQAKGRDLNIVKSLEARKSGGVYYTPQPIVEYIVRTCLAERLSKCKELNEVAQVKVLDPATGSGSFLIKAFDVIKEWYDDYSAIAGKSYMQSAIYQNSQGVIMLTDIGKRILTENLYGVDVDEQAAEIASVNLMLKALEKRKKLPVIIGQSISVSNSLVSASVEDLAKQSIESVTPTLWDKYFKDVFAAGGFDAVVGNPPWGSDLSKIRGYLEKEFKLAKGQYDSYELFMELSKRLLKPEGKWGFVIPDSIFNPEHTPLREFLSTNFQLEKIVRLGEGFFEGVFRASVIVIFSNRKPDPTHNVRCLTVLKEDRTKVRSGVEMELFALEKEKGIDIPQSRLMEGPGYRWEIGSTESDKSLMTRMESRSIKWDEIFDSWRGVELSEDGLVIQCPNCFVWDSPPLKSKGVYKEKVCGSCGHKYAIEKAIAKEHIIVGSEKQGYKPFIEGEGVNRYYIPNKKFINVTKKGINYKEAEVYEGAKLLVRKTGVGIYATIDPSGAYVPQVVFIFKLKGDLPPQLKKYKLAYFLGVLNSRLMLYYYFKRFGDVEWKSFPYLTQGAIKQFPIATIDFANAEQKKLHDTIALLVEKALKKNMQIDNDLDYQIEDAVMKLYQITSDEKTKIWEELGHVQKLRIIRETMGSGDEEK